MKSVRLKIDGMHCEGCANTIEALLTQHSGVKSARVSFAAGHGQVLYDPTVTDAAQVAKAVKDAGFRVQTEPDIRG